MPDHWHGLIELEHEELHLVVNRFKSATALAVNDVLCRRGPVWARAYHDHAVRSDEDLPALARYVIMNPVRAGLVTRVGDYPFWDAAWI